MSRKAQRTPSLSSDAASAQLTAERSWRSLFGSEPPRSATLIEQAIAWKEQVLAEGDVSAAVRRDLALMVQQVRAARVAGAGDPLAAGLLVPPSPSDVGADGVGSDGGAGGTAAAGGAAAALPPASSQLLPGTRLVKLYGGKTHVVEVVIGGMLYDGQSYASLSAVAKAITGTHWNGLLFFGLRKRKVYPAKAAAHG